MGLEFRKAQKEDASLLLFFIRGLASYEKRPEDVTATEEDIRRTVFEEKRAEAFFLLEDGKEIGYGIYYYTFSSFAGAPGLYVEDLFVLPERRGKGYGTAAFKWLAGEALKAGCASMEWSCLDWNEPAILFYRGLGAREKGGNVKFRLEKERMEALLV